MPIPRHPGLSGSNVIPEDWAANQAPVVNNTLDCTVTIGPLGGTPTFDPAEGRTDTSTPTPAYTGPASIGPASTAGSGEGQRVEVVDEQVDIHTYLIKLPAGTPDVVEVDHVVTVTACPSTALVGRRLIVTGIARPAREFSRVITARLYE